MASKIQKVALCSPTGKFGPHLLKALQAEGFDVTVIVRKSSKAVFPAELSVVRVSDEYPKDEMTAAFRGQDAVVLSLSFEMLPHATRFAEASIAAGNRWLIASTYGADLDEPRYALFPASVPHRQAVDDLRGLQDSQPSWSWTSISCGPWPELSVAAQAWNIDPKQKTAELVNGGRHVFTTSTRDQTALAAARILKRQPESAKNKIVHVASFEVDMLTWLDAYKQIVGREGWKTTDVECEFLIKRSQAQLAAGEFIQGYVGSALAVCAGPGFRNHFSSFTTLANEELGLPKEDLVEVVREGLALPNPFA